MVREFDLQIRNFGWWLYSCLPYPGKFISQIYDVFQSVASLSLGHANAKWEDDFGARFSDEIWESSSEMIHTTPVLVLSKIDSNLKGCWNRLVHVDEGQRLWTRLSRFDVAGTGVIWISFNPRLTLWQSCRFQQDVSFYTIGYKYAVWFMPCPL